MRNVSAVLLSALLLITAACSHEQQVVPPVQPAVGQASVQVETPAPPTDEEGANDVNLVESKVADTTLYFDFDDSTLREESKADLQKLAGAMKSGSQPGRVIISGHTDERGTQEYNLALGDRRAQSARDYLVRLGVSPDQLKTLTFGKLEPADPGHDEDAWAKNRRDEIRLTAERPGAGAR
jgi:peptidoglycan-associated lipoprotein